MKAGSLVYFPKYNKNHGKWELRFSNLICPTCWNTKLNPLQTLTSPPYELNTRVPYPGLSAIFKKIPEKPIAYSKLINFIRRKIAKLHYWVFKHLY